MEPSRALLIAYYYCLLMGTNKVISRPTRGVVVYHSVSQPFGLQVPAEDKFSHRLFACVVKKVLKMVKI